MLSFKIRTYYKVLILFVLLFPSHHKSFISAQEISSSTVKNPNKLSTPTIPFYLQDDTATNTVTATTTTAPAYAPIADLDSLATVVRILISLTIVITIAFALSWFLQKRGGMRVGALGKVIGMLPIGNRRFIYMVEIANKVLVLGVTDANINLLCEVTDKDTLDTLRLEGNSMSIPGIEKLFPFLNKSSNVSPAENIDENKDASLNITRDGLNENAFESRIKNINNNLENRKSKK